MFNRTLQLAKTGSEQPGSRLRRRCEAAVLTVLRDLAGASLQQQTDPPASRLDQLDGSGVGHALGALAVDLDDLIPDLEVCDADQRLVRTRS